MLYMTLLMISVPCTARITRLRLLQKPMNLGQSLSRDLSLLVSFHLYRCQLIELEPASFPACNLNWTWKIAPGLCSLLLRWKSIHILKTVFLLKMLLFFYIIIHNFIQAVVFLNFIQDENRCTDY